jgi:hypothetical protein
MTRTLLAVGFTLLALGCRPAESRPEQVLEAFLQEVSFGRAEAAWNDLSKETRDALRERHRQLRRAAGQPPEEPEPAELLYGVAGLTVLNPAESVAVVSPPGDVVTLRVSVEGGRSAEVRMVRRDGVWRVDLRDLLATRSSTVGDAEIPGSGGD